MRPTAAREGAVGMTSSKQHAQQPPREKLTLYCYLVAVIACMGGLSFGYEGPVVSGLIVNPQFLHIFEESNTSGSTQALSSQTSSYCKLNSAALQLYISCSFITAAVATAAAATWTDRFGRKNFILAAAALILIANVLQTAATGKSMLFIGRLVMGLGQGFATFTVPVCVAEMSPASLRGRLGTVYSIATCVGQLLAFAINQAVYSGGSEQGWRIVFAALSWCPLVMLILLGAVLPDTPSSLLQRGHELKANQSFSKLRHSSSHNKDQEWMGMVTEADRIISTKQRHQHHKQHGQHQRQRLSSFRGNSFGDSAAIPIAANCSDVAVAAEQGAAAGVSQDMSCSTGCVSNSNNRSRMQHSDLTASPESAATGTAGAAAAAAAAAAAVDSGSHSTHSTDPRIQDMPRRDLHPAPDSSYIAESANSQVMSVNNGNKNNNNNDNSSSPQLQGGTGSLWPALIIMLHLTVIRSFNGFVNVMYFTALLFSSTGNSTKNSLLAQTLMGVSTLIGGCAAMLGIDKVGRKPLLTSMGFAMAVLMAAAAAILGSGLPPSAAAAGTPLSMGSTAALLVVLCLWQIAFWSSWGPCFYVVLSELYPLKSRAKGVGWGMVTFNLGVVVVLSLGGSMLCSMTYGLLVFFAGVSLYLAVFAAACLPEMRGRQLHNVADAYQSHWLWKHAFALP